MRALVHELRMIQEGDGAEGNEALSWLLSPVGKTAQIGSEKGRAPKDGIGVFKNSSPMGSSWRYVYAVKGAFVAALQVMVTPEGQGRIANVYTAPEARRKGYASQLLAKAEKDLGPVAHSSDLSAAGAAWKAATTRK